MIICIEGADGCGKTTLARGFEAQGFEYVHNGPPKPKEDLFETYTTQLLKAKGRNVVFDRLHVGETIYGPVVRGKSLINVAQLRLLNRLLYSLNGHMIFCRASFAESCKTWQQRPEYVAKVEQLQKIHRMYDDIILNEFRPQTMVYSYENDRAQKSRVERMLYIFNRASILPPGFIGDPLARFVIMGDIVNHTSRDLAFYSDKNSSQFLNECLWDAGFPEWDLMFTNARDICGLENNLKHLRYGIRTVIALGKIAQRACEIQNVPHLATAHPQYVKRFKRREREKYVKFFKEARCPRS